MLNKKNWNVSGIILEGISGTGKTEIFNHLLKNDLFLNKNNPSAVILSEHHTQRVLEKKSREGSLSIKDNIDLLNRHVSYIEYLNSNLEKMDWCDKNMTDMRIPYLFERFHLTHVYQYPHIQWIAVDEIDKRLSELNCKIVVLTAKKEDLGERLYGKPDATWHNYLKRFGKTKGEVVDNFFDQQQKLLEIVNNSSLKNRIINTSIRKINDIVEEIIHLWDQ